MLHTAVANPLTFENQVLLFVFCFYQGRSVFLPLKRTRPFVNLMGLAFGLICVKLLLAVQNSSFCCMILQICVSYYVIFMYYLNYKHTGFTVYCTLLFFSLFPYNDFWTGSLAHRLTSVMKNKVDNENI